MIAAHYWLFRASVKPLAGGGAPLPPSAPTPPSPSQPLASHRALRPCGARPCSRVEPPPPPQLEASAPSPSPLRHVGLQHRRSPARPSASRWRRRRSRGCGRRPSAGPTGRGRPGRRRPWRRWPRWRRRFRGAPHSLPVAAALGSARTPSQRARQIAAKIGGDAATTVNNNTPDFGFGGQKRQLEDGDQPDSKKLASQGDSIGSQLGPIHPPPRTSMTEEYRVPDGMVGLSECGSP